MHEIIHLQTELLVDESTIRDPYPRLLAVVIGQKIVPGSAWVAIDTAVAKAFGFPSAPCLATAPVGSRFINHRRICRGRKTRRCA